MEKQQQQQQRLLLLSEWLRGLEVAIDRLRNLEKGRRDGGSSGSSSDVVVVDAAASSTAEVEDEDSLFVRMFLRRYDRGAATERAETLKMLLEEAVSENNFSKDAEIAVVASSGRY